ncbi:MAG TPA: serine/threonine-protein kinase, partial [Candidatus Dormibacteraeota bacterium]
MPERLGKYRILGTLGTGASGAVFLAHDEELDRDVALKQLAPELAAKPGFLDDFRIEAEIMGRLDHPNCVRVFDFIEEGRAFYIVSEFVDGASLRRVLEDAGRLNPEQALGVTRGALSGLAHAHELGLVHRDIKPENLLADHEGTSKLADFGQAYFTGETLGGGRQSTGEASGGGRQST